MKKITLSYVLISLTFLIFAGCATSPTEVPLKPEPEDTTEDVGPSDPILPTETQLVPTSTEVPTEALVPTDTPTTPPTELPTNTPTLSPSALSFSPGDPIRIGYLLWETHHVGIDMKRSMEIAIADFGGEIHGHPIELTGFDSDCNELAAQRGAQILVRDESVVGILGTTCSRGALRAAPIVSDGDRVLISASSSSPDLTDPESRAPGFFRTAPSDLYQVVAAAEYIYNNLGLRTLATVSIGGEKVMLLQSKALCEAFTALGGECVLERTMEVGSTYMPPVINNLVEFQPEVVYFMGWGIEEAAAFVTAAKDDPVLKDSAIFLWDGYNNSGFLELAGENAVGVYVSVTTFEFDPTPAYDGFIDAYQNKYGEEPQSEFHAYSYDATTLLLKAISLVAVVGEDGSLIIDPYAVREAFYNLPEFDGLTGSINCSPLGECNSSAEGKVYEFVSGDPATYNPGPSTSLNSNPSQVWP